MDDLDHVEQNG